MLERAGLDERTTHWRVFHFHQLRKYFKSWLTLVISNNDMVEFLMGHRASMAQQYFLPDSADQRDKALAQLESEYRKALPQLSFMEDISDLDEQKFQMFRIALGGLEYTEEEIDRVIDEERKKRKKREL